MLTGDGVIEDPKLLYRSWLRLATSLRTLVEVRQVLNPVVDVEEVVRVARSLGLTLGRDEATAYHEQVAAKLRAIDEFMRIRLEEERPPLLFAERGPGHRPSAVEDRFNAWLWKCEIGGSADGLLAGKTVSFKDHTAVAGIPLTLGTRLLDGYIPDIDATVVTRVLAAGGLITGKNGLNGPTNSWGWGLPSDYQRPLNPHNPNHLTGGSSSGSAVAVAAGEVDISFGGDQAGSIRIPAAYCGTYGLKPSFGLVSHFGAGFGTDPSLDYVGPMARHVEDVAAALDAVAGYDTLDPRQDRTVPMGVETRTTLAEGVKGIRIGVLKEGFDGAEPEVREAVIAAVDVLVSAGAEAIDVSVPEHRAAGIANDLLNLEGSRANFDVGFFGASAKTYYPASWIAAAYRIFHEQADRLRPVGKLNLILSEFTRRRFHGTLYAKAQNLRSAYKKAFDTALDRVDVLAMPTCLDVAPKYDGTMPYLDVGLMPRRFVLNTNPFNYTGHPALSVPCGKSAGLPIGMQLVGRFYDEPLLLRTAYAFQHSVEWDELTAPRAATDQN